MGYVTVFFLGIVTLVEWQKAVAALDNSSSEKEENLYDCVVATTVSTYYSKVTLHFVIAQFDLLKVNRAKGYVGKVVLLL